MISPGVVIIAIGLLGLSAGALLTEACVLVPFWRGQSPEGFLAWYRGHAQLLVRYFGTLEVLAAGAAAIWALAAALGFLTNAGPTIAAAVLALLVLASFPVYFKRANAGFSSGRTDPAEVPGELRRWARWHWARTAIAILAFGCALAGLVN